MIDIIIPHFNSVKKLIKLLSTIPENDLFKIYIIDDFSSESLVSLEEFIVKRNNVDLIKNEKNVGAGACRNLGLKLSNSEWVMFADADDFFLKDFDEIIRDTILQTIDKDYIDLIFFTPISCNEDGNESNRHIHYENIVKKYVNDPSEVNALNLRYKFVVPWSKMYRRSMIENNGIFFDEVSVANDVMFSTKCGLKAKEILCIDKIIYCVLKDSGSLTTMISKQKLSQRFDVFVSYNQFLLKNLGEVKYKKLGIVGYDFLLNAYINKYSSKDIIQMLKKMKKNKIKIISTKNFRFVKIKNKVSKMLENTKYQEDESGDNQ